MSTLSPVTVNMTEARKNILRTFKANKVPFLRGSPGFGKSTLFKEIAEEYKLKYIDVRLSQYEPTDLLGFPYIDEKRGKSSYFPFDIFPTSLDTPPEGYKGWLLLLDELPHADPSVQKAAYRLILDRQLGNYDLHPDVYMAAAGNLDTDNAGTEEISTPLQSRMIHFTLKITTDEWIDWALNKGIDHRITSYIKYKPNLLDSFDPRHIDNTYACPRTWHFLSDIIKDIPDLTHQDLPIIAGTVSQGVGREFLTFSKIYEDLVTFDDIVANPEKIPMPEQPSILYALTGSISSNVTEKNIKSVFKFIDRIKPADFQIICVKDIWKRRPELRTNPTVDEWITTNSQEFF